MTEKVCDNIISSLGTCEILCQLAEEASELAQAALKLRRAIDGKNPTPKTVEECRDAIIEEIADIEVCKYLLGFCNTEVCDEVLKIFDRKKKRWAERISERGKNDSKRSD